MDIKILSTITGQQLICEFQTIETNGVTTSCMLKNPKLLIYKQGEDKELMASLSDFCPLSPTVEFRFNLDHISAILEAHDDVVEKYLNIVNPQPIEIPTHEPEIVTAA